jgi:hypothetical protein
MFEETVIKFWWGSAEISRGVEMRQLFLATRALEIRNSGALCAPAGRRLARKTPWRVAGTSSTAVTNSFCEHQGRGSANSARVSPSRTGAIATQHSNGVNSRREPKKGGMSGPARAIILTRCDFRIAACRAQRGDSLPGSSHVKSEKTRSTGGLSSLPNPHFGARGSGNPPW